MTPLSQRFALRKISQLGLAPRTRLARFALLFLGLELLLAGIQQVMVRVGDRAAADGLDGWLSALTVTNLILFTILGLRWVRQVLLWRLRNRLLVTYIFIGVIPVLLIMCMALATGYIFANRFATYLLTSAMDSETAALETANSALAAEVSAISRRPGNIRGVKLQTIGLITSRFPDVEIIAWRGDRPEIVRSPTSATVPSFTQPPAALAAHKGMLVLDHGKLFLRSAIAAKPDLRVVCSVPMNAGFLDRISGGLGQISIHYFEGLRINSGQPPTFIDDQRSQRMTIGKQELSPPLVRAGSLPASRGRWDIELMLGSVLGAIAWSTGESVTPLVQMDTRASVLFSRLNTRASKDSDLIFGALIAAAILFGAIEVFALIIGLGLTRTITRSVAALYRGTQHVNRGDFRHRIPVKTRDQLAALETSFNSMTESLEKLIAEQKEKQRLESELAIAQEVQAQLFPRESVQLHSLELHGICRPARTVSGDYYDFLPITAERLALAVGDISGKGISAALLMATIHSAVRVYEFGGMPDQATLSAASATVGALAPGNGGRLPVAGGNGIHSPREVLWLLNRHLFHTTPAEKYATLFLGVYDGASRTLTYSNAGHLPPLLIGEDGGLRKLDAGGTVIGLFEEISHDESAVQLRSGDLLVAYSDGITEPENEFGEFGEARLLELLRENRRLPLSQLSERVITAVLDWTGGAEQPDDVTLVLARAR